MVGGYIGHKQFVTLDGNLEYARSARVEITKEYRFGRAFSRLGIRTPICTLVGFVDLTSVSHRQQEKIDYTLMVGNVYQVGILCGFSFEVYQNWMVLDVRDITQKTFSPVSGGGVYGGQYMLETEWDLAHIDVPP